MITDIKEFCLLFNTTTGIPIHFFPGTETALSDVPASGAYYSFPDDFEDPEMFRGTLFDFGSFTRNPDYFISESFAYYGYLKLLDTGDSLIIGPLFSTPYSEFTLNNYMQEWSIPAEYKKRVSHLLSGLPVTPFNRFLSTLAYLTLCFNDQVINMDTHFAFEGNDRSSERSQEHSEKVIGSKENQNYHNTWYFEQEMLRLIQEGDVAGLEKHLKNSSGLEEGQVADNSLRQRKNIFISAVTLVNRSAILGGMDMEEAYHLSDVYIRDCERSSSISYLSRLEDKMLFDYTERVAQSRIPEGMSKEVFECIDYIKKNVNTPIQTADVAEHIGRSRSWLYTKFTQELGADPSSFIMQCKLQTVETLLLHSDKTLSEISSYLCFSSQSYFQNVFKKKYGLTPKQFRDQNRKIK